MSKVCSSHNFSSLDSLVNDLDLECVALEIFIKALYELDPDEENYSRYSNALLGLIYNQMEALNCLFNKFYTFRNCLQEEKDF